MEAALSRKYLLRLSLLSRTEEKKSKMHSTKVKQDLQTRLGGDMENAIKIW